MAASPDLMNLGVVLHGLTGTTVNLLLDLSKLTSNVCCVTIKDRRVSIADLSWVIEDNNLGSEVRDSRCRLVLGVRGHVSSLDVLHGDVLDVEANVVSGHGLGERLVVHLHGLDLGGQHVGGEGDDHPGLDDASLNSAHGNCSNTSNFVNILEGKSKRLVSGSGWRNDGIKSLEKSHTTGISLLPLDLPSLVPGHLVRGVYHVVSVPAGDGHEGDGHGVVSDLLDKVGHLLLNLLKPGLAVGRLGGVHLVTGNNELLDTKGVGEEGVFSGLSVLGDTGLKLSSSRGNAH